MKWFGGTGDCLGFVPSCETEKWTDEQWKEYDEFRRILGLPSREEMGSALKKIADRLKDVNSDNIGLLEMFYNEDKSLKPLSDILEKMAEKWNKI